MKDVDRLFAAAEKVLRTVGIAAGQHCLDFGCGHGNYTIPLARMVGPEGRVYVLDKDKSALDKLSERACAAGLSNIERINSSNLKIALDDSSVGVILLYDVIHSHYFTAKQRGLLFQEIGRITEPQALLSIFPHHMENDEIAREVVERAREIGFQTIGEYTGPVVHDDGISAGYVITFRKSVR